MTLWAWAFWEITLYHLYQILFYRLLICRMFYIYKKQEFLESQGGANQLTCSGDTVLQIQRKAEFLCARRIISLSLCPSFHGNSSPGNEQFIRALVLNVSRARGWCYDLFWCSHGLQRSRSNYYVHKEVRQRENEQNGETMAWVAALIFLLPLCRCSGADVFLPWTWNNGQQAAETPTDNLSAHACWCLSTSWTWKRLFQNNRNGPRNQFAIYWKTT